MRKLPLILLLMFVPYVINAQSKFQDIGLNYSGSNLFGVRYKVGNEKTLFRLTIINLGGTNDKQTGTYVTYKLINQGFATYIGFEKSKFVTDNIKFYYGADLLSSYDKFSNKNITTNSNSVEKSLKAGLGCVLGFAYNFSNNVSLSTEIIPSIWYSYSKHSYSNGADIGIQTSKGFGYGFNIANNSFANVTLSFRIRPKHDKDK